MATLRAVHPQRRRGVDLDRVRGNHAGGLAGGNGHVTGVEASDVGHDRVDGSAGLVEGGLGHGVVARHKLELDHVANGGLDIIGREGQGTVGGTDGDDLHSLCCCCDAMLASNSHIILPPSYFSCRGRSRSRFVEHTGGDARNSGEDCCGGELHFECGIV